MWIVEWYSHGLGGHKSNYVLVQDCEVGLLYSAQSKGTDPVNILDNIGGDIIR
jgi:hypothetical protein